MSLNCIRNKTQRYIWASLLLATIIACGILIYMSYIHRGKIKASCLKCKDSSVSLPEKFTQENCQRACTSKECVLAASYLLENMNTSADPCEDFYSFVCGNLLEKLGEEESYSVTSQMERSTKLTLKGILENLKEPYDGLSGKVKTAYDSCMSDSASEANAVPSALEFLMGVGIEGWPHLEDNFRFTRLSVEEAVGKMIAYLEFFFVDFSPTYDEKQSKGGLYNFTIRGSSALMFTDYRLKKYEKVVFQTLNYLEVDNAKANGIWEDFKLIDESILKLSTEFSEMNIDDDSPPILGYSCKDNRNTSLCDILKYVVKYTNNTDRYSTDFVYLESALRVQNILISLERFSHRSVANYLALRFFFNHLDELNTAFRVLVFDIPELFGNRFDFKFSIDKWENCINWLLLRLPLPLSKVYLLNTIYANKMEEIQSIFLTIREVAANFTNQQQWIEGTKREEIKNIIENMSNELETFTSLILKNGSHYIEQFHPTNESFLRNSLEYRNSAFTFWSANIDIDHLVFNPFQTNAYFADKGVQLTYGMILPPVFKHGLPKLLNLATLSPIIGHEFGHHIWVFFESFKDSDISTNVEYKKKTKCLQDQYSSFELKKIGKNVDGIQTLSENLPDLVGFELAQKIINKYAEQENVNSTLVLPALEFSTKQLLYISMAQMWCETSSEEDEQTRYEYSFHAKPEARITNMFRNLKGFSEAFSCPTGSNMNPVNKCSFFEDLSV